MSVQTVESGMSLLRRGLAMTPVLRRGLPLTLFLGAVATAGKVAVPIAIQRGIDAGLLAKGGPDLGITVTVVAVAAAVLLLTTTCTYLVNIRMYRASETALAQVRIRAFRHIHDLSTLHQQAQRRGSMVARVTTDVDQLSQFLQSGGVMLLFNLGQLVLATLVMFGYSPLLTLVVYAVFAPVVFVVRHLQRRLADRYATVRRYVGTLLSAISESVVGAGVLRAYGVADRTQRRLDQAIEDNRRAQFAALRVSVAGSAAAETSAGIATAAVVTIGVLVGVDGSLSVGQLTAMLFLVALFVQPVQMATEILNDAQNAMAGWRRVLGIIDAEVDVPDPVDGVDLPEGPVDVRFEHVDFAYPDGPTVISDVDFTVTAGARIAVVGATGSGKSTMAKLLTRMMDPASGQVLLSGVPLRRVRFASLRSRVVLVPQDGFLFDATLADNVRFGADTAGAEGAGALTEQRLTEVFEVLGLGDWLRDLPAGLLTPVGERGESLSVGERQLVALVRAYLADPDLLVLDEATSAVDPATQLRMQRALDAVTVGRTTVTIAHRLTTARDADEVLVVDAGRLVQRGTHDELLAQAGSVYAKLYASWLDQAA